MSVLRRLGHLGHRPSQKANVTYEYPQLLFDGYDLIDASSQNYELPRMDVVAETRGDDDGDPIGREAWWAYRLKDKFWAKEKGANLSNTIDPRFKCRWRNMYYQSDCPRLILETQRKNVENAAKARAVIEQRIQNKLKNAKNIDFGNGYILKKPTLRNVYQNDWVDVVHRRDDPQGGTYADDDVLRNMRMGYMRYKNRKSNAPQYRWAKKYDGNYDWTNPIDPKFSCTMQNLYWNKDCPDLMRSGL